MPHRHNPQQYDRKQRAFALGVLLNVLFVAAEATFGFLSGSLALLADAGHNLSDVLGLFLAWAANLLSGRRPTRQRTFGWRSSTIMAALLNALILLVVVGAIAWEAILRFFHPPPVSGTTVIVVALVGMAINTFTALLFVRDRKTDLNVRGAFLHMAADAAVSGAVAVGGVLILFTGMRWLDPAVSLLVALVILLSTWRLLRESLDMAMHAVPPGIDTREIENYLVGLTGIEAVHDLHVWAMSTTENALTAHLVKPDPEGDDDLIARIQKTLYDRFNIDHITIQWERDVRAAQCSPDRCKLGTT